jgi:hypothetical protein
MGGDASIFLGGDDNAIQNERTWGPDFWAFWPGPSLRPRRPRLLDDAWPFEDREPL